MIFTLSPAVRRISSAISVSVEPSAVPPSSNGGPPGARASGGVFPFAPFPPANTRTTLEGTPISYPRFARNGGRSSLLECYGRQDNLVDTGRGPGGRLLGRHLAPPFAMRREFGIVRGLKLRELLGGLRLGEIF